MIWRRTTKKLKKNGRFTHIGDDEETCGGEAETHGHIGRYDRDKHISFSC
jgi:hypothetical protein